MNNFTEPIRSFPTKTVAEAIHLVEGIAREAERRQMRGSVQNNRRKYFDEINRGHAEREARQKNDDNIRRF